MDHILLGTTNLLVYFIVAVVIAFSIRILFTINNEVFRKLLHFILLGSFLVLIISFSTWQITAMVAIIFEVSVYPVLILFERLKKYSEFTTERKKGELKHSLILVYTMFAVVVGVCWGIFGDKYIAIASLYAWGIGDAAAALIGKKFGKHKIRAPHLDGTKSYEGTLAMYLVSCISVFTILMLRGGMPIMSYIIISLIVGAISAVVELYSKNGNDTVFCPLAAMVTMLPLVYLFGGM